MEELLWDFEKDMGSPFQPGKPVSYNNLIGREVSAKKILRYAKQASQGDPQHFFLTGERGIGKTSLAQFTLNYVEKYLGSTGIYITNKSNDTLESFIDAVIEGFLNKLPNHMIKDTVKKLFGRVESLEIHKTKIKFKSGDKSEIIIRNFPFYIQDLINKINPEEGVFLVVDDINGLSESKEFVDWYKGFADTIEVDKEINLKLYILFAGYKEKFHNLTLHEPSFGRIFHYENLETLSDLEIREFFIKNFEEYNISYSNKSLDNFVHYSQGIPLMMQQIGEYAFWTMKNNTIDEDTSFLSINHAANEIANKQLFRFITIIQDFHYESILMKLGKNDSFLFDKEKFGENLSEDELKRYDKFLENMILLDIIKKNKNQFYFENRLCYAYILIKSKF